MVQLMRRVFLALFLLSPALLSGCAARATWRLVEADQHVQAAISAGAGTNAPYETTLARAYLEKAREEAGASDFGAAELLARRAIELADAAVTRVKDDDRAPQLTGKAVEALPDDAAAPSDPRWPPQQQCKPLFPLPARLS